MDGCPDSPTQAHNMQVSVLTDHPTLWAHRGLPRRCPENTQVSFRQALEDGADGIWGEVHLTADQQIVCLTDDSVDRTTNGSGLVRTLSLAAARSLDAGSHFAREFQGEKISRLDEMLQLALDSHRWRAPARKVVLELAGPKSGLPALGRAAAWAGSLQELRDCPAYEALPRHLVVALRGYRREVASKRILVASFHRPYLDELQHLCPELALIYLSNATAQGWLEREDLENHRVADGVCVPLSYLSAEVVAKLRKHHDMVLGWENSRSGASLERALSLSIDGIRTTNADLAVEVFERAGFKSARTDCCGWGGSMPWSARSGLSASKDSESFLSLVGISCCYMRASD
jgi:glycerophosphoryl diester phosphodiesterase